MNNTVSKGFSRYERNGIILLCFLIVVSIISKKYIVQYFTKDGTPLASIDKAKLAKLQQQINDAKTGYGYKEGLSDKIDVNDNTGNLSKKSSYIKKDKYDFKIEVNSATPEEYERLYGIGKVLAARIVSFRDKLGGFYSLEQIKDVYGIQDSAYLKFKRNLTIQPAKIKKININTATFEELTANPYFFSTVAKQVIGYRSKVKPFASVEDVKNLYFVKDHPEHYNKMLPYISIN